VFCTCSSPLLPLSPNPPFPFPMSPVPLVPLPGAMGRDPGVVEGTTFPPPRCTMGVVDANLKPGNCGLVVAVAAAAVDDAADNPRTDADAMLDTLGRSPAPWDGQSLPVAPAAAPNAHSVVCCCVCRPVVGCCPAPSDGTCCSWAAAAVLERKQKYNKNHKRLLDHYSYAIHRCKKRSLL
jgi:hypothetical protein